MARLPLIISGLVVILTVFGLVMIGNASAVAAAADFGDKWYFLKQQAMWAGVGLVGFGVASVWPYAKWKILARPLFIASLVSLVAVLIPGVGSKFLGARRWINLGAFGFQPAELAKLGLTVYLASYIKKGAAIWPFLTTVGLLAGLIMLQPDLGSTIILVATALTIYFGGGGSLKPLLMLVPALAGVALVLILVSPYRLARLQTFLDVSRDPQGSSYHIRQVLIGIGSGGIFGVGLGQSRQKYEFLPEVTTDSIFAVVAEETGLIGGTILLLAFVTLVYAGFKVARSTTDTFGANLALGITGWLGWQALVNLAAMVALVPLTGIPLPFISYGGSALVINLVASGILVNIARSKD